MEEKKVEKKPKKKRPEIRIENWFRFNGKMYIVNKPLIFTIHHVSGGKGAMFAMNKPLAITTASWPVNNWTDLEYEVFKTLDDLSEKYRNVAERFKSEDHWLTCKKYYQRAEKV